MSLSEDLAAFHPHKDMLLTVGVFDGVHLGHKYLIARLVAAAKERHMQSGVITFRRHPREVLSPSLMLPRLTDPQQKVELLKQEGVDAVVVLSFDGEMSSISARDFVVLLQNKLRMKGLVVGPDFALGKNREGDIDTLRKMGQEMGFDITVVSPKRVSRAIVSSTAIRKAMAAGDVKKVNSMLGRPFSLIGRVVSGSHRGGSQLGFPTINLDVDANQALPPDGVYATRTHIDGKTYQSMTNVGTRPTFGGESRTIESHILDFQGDVYGHEARLDFIGRLRDEVKFESVDALKKQIAKDIVKGRAMLASEDYGQFRYIDE
jgi:riboflavin kinase / FMN adenylyltransferase